MASVRAVCRARVSVCVCCPFPPRGCARGATLAALRFCSASLRLVCTPLLPGTHPHLHVVLAAIDSLEFDFPVIGGGADGGGGEEALTTAPKEGAYITGLFLEGARWDGENGCLREPEPMQLFASMPVVHFRPREVVRDKGRGFYKCPLFQYPVRTGTRERPSFVVPVDLRTGAADPEHWVRRGTALLLSLAT
jgi:hypothetical protein